MGNIREAGRIVRTPDDARIITNTTERNFVLVILSHNPDLVIIREPGLFLHTREDGRTIGTTPDFLVINPHNPLVPGGVYVEITTDNRNGSDPKAKQRYVMEQEAPNERYVVLYGQHLRRVQNGHPDIPLQIGGHTSRNGKIPKEHVVFSSP